MEASTLTERITRASRSGHAERLRARVPRYAFIGLCVVLALLGLRDLVAGRPAPIVPPAAASGDLAMYSFATSFARAYLTYDANDEQAREDRLAPFIPSFLDADGGYSPRRGSQQVLWDNVAQDQDAIAGGRIITVAAGVSTQSAAVYLAVPVSRGPAGALQLTGYPSFVGPPTTSTDSDQPLYDPVEDGALTQVAGRVVTNYLGRSSENLKADLGPDVSVSLPTVALTVDQIGDVVWADTAHRAVLVTVDATDANGGDYSLLYELGVELSGTRWLVRWIEVVPNA